MDEKCKSSANEYPNVECVNCGEKHYNFVAKNYPSYLDCPKKTKSNTNYNKIKNMSIENMAEFISNNATNNFCDLICNGECRALGTLNKPADEVCKKIITHWLNSTVNE